MLECYIWFIICLSAYEILSDSEKRKQYDQLGHENFEEQQTKFGSGGGAGGFGNFNFNDFFKQFDESLKFFQTGKKQRQNGRGHTFNFGSDFWDDLDNDDLFGGFGNFGFNGGFGDTFINLQDLGFGGDLFGNAGQAHKAHKVSCFDTIIKLSVFVYLFVFV